MRKNDFIMQVHMYLFGEFISELLEWLCSMLTDVFVHLYFYTDYSILFANVSELRNELNYCRRGNKFQIKTHLLLREWSACFWVIGLVCYPMEIWAGLSKPIFLNKTCTSKKLGKCHFTYLLVLYYKIYYLQYIIAFA